MNDEYLKLLEDTRDALHALIRATEPGGDMTAFCFMYTAIKTKIDAEANRAEWEARRAERAEDWAKPQWSSLSTDDREREVLDTLASDRLTIAELTERLQAKHEPDLRVYQSYVQSVVKRLLRERKLDRAPETFRKTHRRYRYFRWVALDGPIVGLDRVFHGDEAVTA